jgi:hypothetical protein
MAEIRYFYGYDVNLLPIISAINEISCPRGGQDGCLVCCCAV